MEFRAQAAVLLMGIAIARYSAAESQTLIIAGDANTERHKAISQIAYETDTKRGRTVHIAARDGKWNFAPANRMHPASSKQDIENIIKKMATSLDPGDTLTLFINDHGDAPDSVDQSSSSGIVLYHDKNAKGPTPKITHKELTEILKKYIPASVHIKLTGIHCFGGGLHDISFELPNACSSSSSDFRTVTYSTKKINLYGKGFWNEIESRTHDINHDGKTSLFEAHLAGFMFDSKNEGRGTLSSMAYVDSILNEGAYNGKNTLGFMHLITGIAPGPGHKEEVQACKYNENLIAVKEIESISSTLSQIAFQVELPQSIQTVYEWAEQDWKKNKSEYIFKLNSLKSEYANLKAKWNRLGPIAKLRLRRKYTKKFDELETRTKHELAAFLAIYRTMENISKTERFLQKASPSQKATYTRLLQCEWEVL